MSRKGPDPIPFGGLSATVDPSLVPLGNFAAMEGASVERSALETGPRWGDAWSRPGAAGGDVGKGLYFGQFGTTSEYLAIVKANGEATCRAYSVTTGGVWTQLAAGLPNAVWTFRQYEDRVYACAAGAGMWIHTVGFTGTSDPDAGNIKFDPFGPTYTGLVGAAQIALSRPAYPVRNWTTSDTIVDFDTVASGFCQVVAATNEIAVRTGMTSSTRSKFVQTCVVTLPATVDLTGVDWLQYDLTPAASGSYALTGTQGGQEPGSNTGTPANAPLAGTYDQIFAITSDGVSAITQVWADAQPRATLSIYGADGAKKTVVCDLRAISNAVKASVKRIIFHVAVSWVGNGGEVRISPLTYGGSLLYDWSAAQPDAPAIDYAVCFRNPATNALTVATKSTLGKYQGAGIIVGDTAKRPLGAWASLTEPANATLAGQGYTKCCLYRGLSATSLIPGGGILTKWYRVAEADNTGSSIVLTDQVPQTILPSKPSSTLTFGEVGATLTADAIGLWKQHFLIFSDRKMFGSWGGEPTRFLPPPEDDFEAPDESQTTQGRTLYIAPDRAEGAVVSVEGDLLYVVGPRTSSVMIGDSLFEATPFRRLPGARGSLGPKASCPHDSGVLVASRDALWYLEATRAFTGGSDGTYRMEEMTDGIREAWRTFVGADGSGMVISSFEDEVWLFNGTRYLRLTRPLADGSRAWESGPFPALSAIASATGFGSRAMLADGRIARLWRDANNARYESDGGATANWSATTGWIPSGRQILVEVFVRCVGTPQVVVEIDDGQKGVKTDTITLDSGRRNPLRVGKAPGTQHRFTFSGQAGRDKILDVYATWESASSNNGN